MAAVRAMKNRHFPLQRFEMPWGMVRVSWLANFLEQTFH
jgi:hypothetical protein